MGLFVPEAAANFTASDISGLLSEVARATGAAAAILKTQPFSWDGSPNPFAGLTHQLTPSSGYAVTLGDFDALHEKRFSKRSRSTLNHKERKLADAGPLTYGWAETRAERLQIVDAFFAQRAHARAFYREVALLEGDNPSRLRLGYIKVSDAVLATFSGTVCHGRMSVVLCSLADGDMQRRPRVLSCSSIRSRKLPPMDSPFTTSASARPAIRTSGPTWSSPCSTASSLSNRMGSP
jgi:hypothetical protein